MEKKQVIEIPIGESTVAETERRLILATVDHFEGNKSKAADALGLCLKTIYNRLRAYGIAA